MLQSVECYCSSKLHQGEIKEFYGHGKMSRQMIKNLCTCTLVSTLNFHQINNFHVYGKINKCGLAHFYITPLMLHETPRNDRV